MKNHVLHTVWCYISGEAAGEIWNWSLLGVKGLNLVKPNLFPAGWAWLSTILTCLLIFCSLHFQDGFAAPEEEAAIDDEAPPFGDEQDEYWGAQRTTLAGWLGVFWPNQALLLLFSHSPQTMTSQQGSMCQQIIHWYWKYICKQQHTATQEAIMLAKWRFPFHVCAVCYACGMVHFV